MNWHKFVFIYLFNYISNHFQWKSQFSCYNCNAIQYGVYRLFKKLFYLAIFTLSLFARSELAVYIYMYVNVDVCGSDILPRRVCRYNNRREQKYEKYCYFLPVQRSPPPYPVYRFRLWNTSFSPFKCSSHCPGDWKPKASRWNYVLDEYNVCNYYVRARGRKSHCFIRTRPDHGALSQRLKVRTSCMLDGGQSARVHNIYSANPPGWCTWQLELIYPMSTVPIPRSPSTRRITLCIQWGRNA